MSTVDILREARELIADKSRWTQYAFARDASGEKASSWDSDAVCWCAVGAFNRAASDLPDAVTSPIFQRLMRVSSRIYGADIASVNDSTCNADLRGHDPHFAVLSIYDAAIAEVEAANA